MELLEWIILIWSLVISFCCSVIETLTCSLSDWEIRLLRHENGGQGSSTRKLRPESLLIAVSLGNTLTTSSIAGLVVWWIVSGRYSWLPAIITGFGSLLLLGEVLPKALVLRSPNSWQAWIRRALEIGAWIPEKVLCAIHRQTLSLIRRLVGHIQPAAHSDSDYKELLEMATEAGVLEPEEKTWILAIMDLDKLEVGQIMRPRSQIKMLPADLPLDRLIEEARKIGYRRIPLYDHDSELVAGILNVWRLLLEGGEGDLDQFVELPSYVPETMPLARLLKSLQLQKRGMAIVLDEFGNLSGLVTTSDILRRVFGERKEEAISLSAQIRKIGPNIWEVDGTLPIEHLRRLIPDLQKPEQVSTVAGLLMYLTGEILQPRREVIWSGAKFVVIEADRKRILKARVERLAGRLRRGGTESKGDC